jgi:aspartyl-tRNA(Asn)/glutamyl-tRNA(Gln) amidotransferase subunit B
LGRLDDADALADAAEQAVRDNPRAVADYCGGKVTAIAFLVGRVMHATRGQADANVVREHLRAALDRVCSEANAPTSTKDDGT